MADAGPGGNHAEVVKRRLAPFQEGIAFQVAFVFAVDVHLERARVAEFVDHDRVVDDQVNRVQRVDLLGVAPQCLDAVAHGGQIDHGRNAGEVLHQHAGGAIGDLARVLATFGGPFGEGLDVFDGHGATAVLKAQHVFQHHFQSGGQLGKVAQAGGLRGGNGIISNLGAPGAECLAGFGRVLADNDGHGCGSLIGCVRVKAAPRLPDAGPEIKRAG